ncbi:hypothetical protein [Mycetocola saprophilus]|uniref:DUF7927 domain-containing protein n=1 Tax=Mycetocola saprophilus TaxID=76636 RepID=UPI000AB754C7|nr:hypothetical protein [Mycetocola saprophilus]
MARVNNTAGRAGTAPVRTRRLRMAGAALLVAGLAAGATVPLIGETTAGYTDSAFALAEGVAVPPTTALASVVPSYALDTMQVVDVAGNLWIWGYYGNSGPSTSSAGQGGGSNGIDYSTGTAFNNHKPNQFKALTNIRAMASSAYANYAIDEHGNLFGWGQNNGGLYMFGNNFNGSGRIVPPGTTPENVVTNWADAIIDTDVVSVSSVEYGAAYAKADGTVWTVGDNALSQRGQGFSGNGNAALRVATQVTDWPGGAHPDIVSVSSGYEGYYAIAADNTVYFWGRSFRDGAGSLNTNLTAAGCQTVSATYRDYRCSKPVEIPELTAVAQNEGIKELGGGYSHGHMVTERGNLYAWGSEENNYSGNDELASSSTNGTLPRLKAADVVASSSRFGSTQYITKDGAAWAYGNRLWGGAFSLDNTQAKPTNGDDLTGKVWDPQADPKKRKAVQVGGNKDSATILLDDGTVLSWGENGGGAACGGFTYANCKTADGSVATVTATGGTSGLYVWPLTLVTGIQNVGRYQTITLNSSPFTGSAVMSGQRIGYRALARNPLTEEATYTVSVDLSGLGSDAEVDPETIRITVGDDDPIRGVQTDGVVTWTGKVPANSQILITLDAVVKPGVPGGATLNVSANLRVKDSTNADSDTVAHITTTNPADLEGCDSCVIP